MTTTDSYEWIRSFFAQPKLLLAPMAGVTDLAMRELCIEQGADLTYTEMVSTMALSFSNQKSFDLLRRGNNEEKVAVQIFGHNPVVMAKEATVIEESLAEHLAYIDINMGCPAKKIVTKGDGSALMTSPELAERIVTEVVNATNCPVTVKFRRGFEMDNETAPEFAQRMEQAGAAACTVHGRFSKQFYTGKSDYGVIARVKQAVSIPVIGNGDITSGDDARSMLESTHCDSLMIGRAAQGNPWVFNEIKAIISGKEQPPRPNIEEILNMARRHAKRLSECEKHNIVRMRKHAMWYVAGQPGATKARGSFNECSSYEEFDAAFKELATFGKRGY